MPDASPVPPAGNIVVCLSSGGPDASLLLDKGADLAARMGGHLYALHVEPPAGEAREQGMRLGAAFAYAAKLGATVFTYRGRDVARTIVEFAREYDVAHVIMGRPAVSWAARVMGRSSLLDRLLTAGPALAVVVLHTRSPGEDGKQAPALVPDTLPRLSRFLTPERILLWDRPVTRDEVLDRLLRTLAEEVPGISFDDLRARIEAREQELSTFLDEGVALPHLRLPEVRQPIVALGITKGGVSDVTTQEPIEMVWVLLLPTENTPGFMPISIVSRIFQDTPTRRKLGRARRPEDALALLQGWELLHPAAPTRTL